MGAYAKIVFSTQPCWMTVYNDMIAHKEHYLKQVIIICLYTCLFKWCAHIWGSTKSVLLNTSYMETEVLGSRSWRRCLSVFGWFPSPALNVWTRFKTMIFIMKKQHICLIFRIILSKNWMNNEKTEQQKRWLGRYGTTWSAFNFLLIIHFVVFKDSKSLPLDVQIW